MPGQKESLTKARIKTAVSHICGYLWYEPLLLPKGSSKCKPSDHPKLQILGKQYCACMVNQHGNYGNPFQRKSADAKSLLCHPCSPVFFFLTLFLGFSEKAFPLSRQTDCSFTISSLISFICSGSLGIGCSWDVSSKSSHSIPPGSANFWE